MGKMIQTYAGYTTACIIGRTSFPPSGCLYDCSTYIEACNMKQSDLKNTLGETHNNQVCLQTTPNINCYAHYQGGYWCFNPSTNTIGYVNDQTPWVLSDMAGYNHNALAPYKENYSTCCNIPSAGGTITVHPNVFAGEYDWRDTFLKTVDGMEMVVKQGASIVGCHQIDYTDSTHQNGFNFSDAICLAGATTLCVQFNLTCSNSCVSPVPNSLNYNISVGVIYSAAIGDVTLSSDLIASNPTWNLVYDSNLSEINQVNDTYSLRYLAIDNDSDGEGDVTRFNMELFARVNGGKWYSAQSGINMTPTGVNIIDDALPVGVGNGDIVDFELRDA